MKKSLFFYAAAAALMLTACSSEDDILQTGQTKKVAPQEVGFDVYTPAVTDVTRAGQAGTMTTGRLQRLPENDGGFGVYAYLVEDDKTDAGDGTTEALGYVAWQNRTTPTKAPNFMVNQLVKWNNTNLGWEYAPLKYWPNETDNDSQSTPAEMIGSSSTSHLDRLTFFAYAPYVTAGVNEPGITHLTNMKGYLDQNPTSTSTTGSLVEASVGYKTALTAPSSSVDLLWGVVPAGDLTYTAVNGYTVSRKEGTPLLDMIKPDVNTSMKFLFQHALARIGINVVAAIDQVGAGGTLNTEETKITIKEVTLTGPFGATGILNLDNPTQSVANWTKIDDVTLSSSTTALTGGNTLELSADAHTIAPNLCYEGEHTFGSYSKQTVGGVTTSKQDLIAPRYFELDAAPAYDPAKKYYSDGNGTVAIAYYAVQDADRIYTYDSENGKYVLASGSIPSSGTYYSVTPGATTFDGSHVLKKEKRYQTAEEVNAKNATLGGALNSTDPLTADQAANYNAKLTGAISTETELTTDQATTLNGIDGVSSTVYAAGNHPTAEDAILYNAKLSDAKTSGNTLSADDANTYNAQLPGAVSIGDLISAAEYGYKNSYLPASTILYARSGEAGAYKYSYVGTKANVMWAADNTTTYCTIASSSEIAATDIAFEYSGTIYDAERNYFMVIPTNNVKTLNTGLAADKDKEEALRTIRVKIVYYVTTEDDKIDGGRTQIENVIEKDVLFPSLANGKSYMLNLVLGLTSVKMEAEVDDWKVVNVQADLPQNTAE